MLLKINLKKLLLFSLVFIIFTPIGTLSHEYGHILVAKSFGYETSLHFGSMHYDHPDLQTMPIEEYEFSSLMISIGGPAQTILTGLIGLLILWLRRKKRRLVGMKTLDWLAVFLSLFWLREVFNVVVGVGIELFTPDGSYFGGDEKKIAELMGLPSGIIAIILGALGAFITAYIIFKVTPKIMRLNFILGGLIGGISGFYLWLYLIGPQLLP